VIGRKNKEFLFVISKNKRRMESQPSILVINNPNLDQIAPSLDFLATVTMTKF
jgi:hypothetical protein